MIKPAYISSALPTGMIPYMEMQVKVAIAEDVGTGDLTAQLLPEHQIVSAHIIARENAVLCGVDWATTCFKLVDGTTQINWQVAEGAKVSANQVLCKLSGNARSLYTAERCALNFLQTLSATATETAKYVKAIAGTNARILDTRKTIPGLRLAQKYAVTVGGGLNQRLALYDGILIKENHIAAAGSIRQVLQNAFMLNTQKSIQIEVENLQQLKEALDAGAQNILLDNFSPALLFEAVAFNQRQTKLAILEASGNVNLDTVRNIALTGVDRISVGNLTKNVNAIDLSMRFS
jgi:nicotinate-nucleotide pyrophosphorylase (carboxylating)